MQTHNEELYNLERRVTVIETQMQERASQREEREQERRNANAEVLRRLSTVEATLVEVRQQLIKLTEQTKSHVVKATCINGSAKILQGAGATGGIGGGIIMAIWALKELGVL